MKPTVIWITGLSGAGKTTTANALKDFLKEKGYKVGTVDGDDVRRLFDKPVGFSIMDRIKANNAAVYAARNMFEFQKVEIVIVSMISPLKEMRDNARDLLTKYCKARFIEVYMDTPLEICEQRDSKGLYKKARTGEIKDFTGIDSPYQIPEFPEVRIHPNSTLFGEMTVDRAVNIIYNRIQTNTIL
jgi:adenylyl-sulfate kinase